MREAETNVAATCGRRGGGRESGRERGGDKPYESRKREAMRAGEGEGREWSGKGMAMLGSDSDMGVAEGRGGLDSIRFDLIRFDSTVYQRYSFSSLSLSLSLHVPRVLSLSQL